MHENKYFRESGIFCGSPINSSEFCLRVDSGVATWVAIRIPRHLRYHHIVQD